MVEMLDHIALWQRIWGIPLRAFNEYITSKPHLPV